MFQVAVEDDYTGSGQSSAPASQFEMNPQQSSQPPASYGPGPFYQGPPGPGFPGPQGGGYPGPMSPYGGGPPISPHYQAPNGAGGPAAAMYANQNSPLYNQNQSSSGYPGGGPGNYSSQGPGGFPGAGAGSMQSYYNNHSPTHGPPGQYQYGGPAPVRLSPPPMNMMGLGARIPQPTMNSPNQNVVTGGSNPMKTENMDLSKQQQQGYHGVPVSQGFSGVPGGGAGYSYNGYSAPARPLVSPMSPHTGGQRLNISPGGPTLSPREAPGSSPHPSLYSAPQPSPGPYTGSYQAQYEAAYFSKQQQPSQSGHSPLSSGSGGYPGLKEEKMSGYQGEGDKMSDVGSAGGSVRSSDTGDTGGDTGETGPSLTALTSAKEKESTADKDKTDSDIDNKFTPKSEPEDPSNAAVKPEPGSYFDEHKDFTLKANQTLIDNMNMDSIPELPEIPELKYEDMSEMRGLGHGDAAAETIKKTETPPGLSPDLKEAPGLGARGWEEGAEEDGGYMGGWGHGMPGQQAPGRNYRV